jgi:integrase
MQRYTATFSIQWYCRKTKTNKAGEAPIEMCINYQGSRFFITIPRKAVPSAFERMMKSRKNADLKDYLNSLERRIRGYEEECIQDGEAVTVEGIKAFIRAGYTRPGKSVQALLDCFFASLETRMNTGRLSKGVYRKYELVTKKFLETSGIDTRQRATVISTGAVRKYCEWCDNTYVNSTSVGMKTRLKSLLIFARDNGFITTNPFQDKIVKEERIVETISDEDVEKIKNKHFDNRLEQVKNAFLFACGTGLAYVDIANLKEDEIKMNDRGQYYINKERAKTGVKYTIVLLPIAIEIYKKGLPRILSNQKTNEYLKEIGNICKTSVIPHFHLARHYYAITLLNKYKLSYEVTARCLGHSNTKITRHYAKMLNSTVFDAFENV